MVRGQIKATASVSNHLLTAYSLKDSLCFTQTLHQHYCYYYDLQPSTATANQLPSQVVLHK